MKLNSEQQKCVEACDGNKLIIAGPGSGKTTVMAHHMAYLVNEKKVPEDKIKGFTFTNQATAEMNKRVKKVLGREHKIDISNFHSFTFEWLKFYYRIKYKVLTDDEKRRIIKKLVEDNGYNLDLDYVIHEISRIKNMMNPNFSSLEARIKVADIYFKYQTYIEKAQKMDYDEMNYLFLDKLKSDADFRSLLLEQYKYIIVDETQDINHVQYEILKILSSKSHNLYMVGDPNQSIYAFRGSDITILDDFRDTEGAEVLHLTNNYRSKISIVEAANTLIRHNTNTLNLDSVPVSEEQGDLKVVYPHNMLEQADYVATQINHLIDEGYKYSDIKILYRTNYSPKLIDLELNRQRIPHFVHGISFLEHKEIIILTSYLEFLINPDDDEAFETIINHPSRGIGDVSVSKIRLKAKLLNTSYYKTAKELIKEIPKLKEFFDTVDELMELKERTFFGDLVMTIINDYINLKQLTKDPKNKKNRVANLQYFWELAQYEMHSTKNEDIRRFLNSLYMKDNSETKDGVVELMTIHQAKGLEAKVIFIIDLIDSMFPGRRYDYDLEEERRVFYVGMTRAIDKLYLSAPRNFRYGEESDYMECRFLSEIKKRRTI